MQIDREKNTVSFELDDRDINVFELAANLSKEDVDILFKVWVKELARKALRDSMPGINANREMSTTNNIHHIYTDAEYDERILKSVRKCEIKQTGSTFEVICCFVEHSDDGIHANRQRMEEEFVLRFGHNHNEGTLTKEEIFRNRFRMMCSNAPGAYGQIFSYDQIKDEAILNSILVNEIKNNKDKFKNK